MKPAITALACCILAAACSPLANRPVPVARNEQTPRQAHSFQVLNHGWHTGLVVRCTDLNKRIPELKRRFPHGTYYEIGWGDAGFYRAHHITAGLALQAMFASPGTVVHVVAFDPPPREFFPNSQCREVTATNAGYTSMLEYVHSGFATDSKGRIIPCGAGLYGESAFYQGSGRYHAFHTCNTWTASALARAGVNIHPSFSLAAGSVMRAVERHGEPSGKPR